MRDVTSPRLRPFLAADEGVARDARSDFRGSDFDFLFDFDPNEPWSAWTARMGRYYRGEGLAPDRVRSAYLAAEVDNELVGAVSIRLELNEYLATRGGHIGYGVLPGHRGHGYATAMLRAAVEIAHREGVRDVLVTVSDTNVASIHVIENCGGRQELDVIDAERAPVRRYWFTAGDRSM